MGIFSKDKHSDLPQVPFYEYARGGALNKLWDNKSTGEVMREEAKVEEDRARMKRKNGKS